MNNIKFIDSVKGGELKESSKQFAEWSNFHLYKDDKLIGKGTIYYVFMGSKANISCSVRGMDALNLPFDGSVMSTVNKARLYIEDHFNSIRKVEVEKVMQIFNARPENKGWLAAV